MRKLGKTRRQKLVRLRDVKALASMRKFDEHGDWHYFTQLIPQGVPALLRPSTRTELAKRYWYDVDR